MCENKRTYKLTFTVNAESLDQAIDILDKISFEEKLKYVEKNKNFFSLSRN